MSFSFVSRFRIKKEREDLQVVMDNIREGIEFRGTNLWVLIFAIFIASLGLNLNSTAVVIGAMLISPLMGPIMGIGVSMAVNDSFLLRRSIHNLLFSIGVSLVASTIYFLITPLSEAHSEILARTSPTIYDVLIAVFGGLAGIIAMTSTRKGNVIPGVAIATALMPPLCTAGYGIATGNLEYFFGASYLFFINTVFIAISALVVARILRFPYKEFPELEEKKRSRRIIGATILIALVPSIYFGYDIVQQAQFTGQANRFVDIEGVIDGDYLLKKTIDPKTKAITLIYGGAIITDEQIAVMKSRLAIYNLDKATLDIRQGFASLYETPQVSQAIGVDQEKVDELTKSLNEKEKEIQANEQAKTDADATAQAVFDELAALSPKVANLAIDIGSGFSSAGKYDISFVILGLKVDFTKDEKTMIESWLKKRLQNDRIEVIEKVLE